MGIITAQSRVTSAAQPTTSARATSSRALPFSVELTNVHKKFGELAVLRGVTLRVPRGETTCIMGGSGSGKSVTLKLIARLLEPDEGKIVLEGQDISHVDRHELEAARKKLGVLFQTGALLQSLTVAGNVALPLHENTTLGDREIEERVSKVLELLKISDSKDLLPGAISGGMRKRVALARAVILEPKVVLYDEPTSGLDPVNAAHVDEMILDMEKSIDITQIVVTHNVSSMFRIADRVAMLYEGKIIFDGTPEEAKVTDQPVVRQFLSGQTDGPMGNEV